MRWLWVLVAISCGSPTPPAPAPPVPPPVVAVSRDAAVAVVTPDAAPTPPPSPCDDDETSFECRCEKGEPAGCVGLAESELRRGQNDIAIARVLPLCEQGVVEACFAAAKFLKQRRLASRHGQSSADLTARGMAILDERCAANSSDGCLQLGRILLAGKLVAKDPKRGFEVVDKACTAKNVRACAFLGSMYVAGEGVKKDIKRGTKLLEEACSGGGSNACAALANVIAKKNKQRAQELYAKACAGDDGEGCAKSGNVTRACELEHAESCMAAGPKETDPVRQRAAYQRACDAAIAPGCVALAPLVATGKGGPREYGTGVELASAACKTKTPKACATEKELRANPPTVTCKTAEECSAPCDDEKIPSACRALADLELATDTSNCDLADEGLRKACDFGDAIACIERGHIATSAQEASEWYAKGCAAKHAAACILRDRADSTGRDGDRKKQTATLKKACADRVAGACVMYGEELGFAKGWSPEAEKLFTAACDANETRGCRRLARYLLDARPPGSKRKEADDQVQARATALVQKACTLGDPNACAILRAAGDASIRDEQVQLRCMIDPVWTSF